MLRQRTRANASCSITTTIGAMLQASSGSNNIPKVIPTGQYIDIIKVIQLQKSVD